MFASRAFESKWCLVISQIPSRSYPVMPVARSLRISGNAVSLIRKPRSGKARDRVLTAAERAALLSACGQCHNPWIEPVVIFALETCLSCLAWASSFASASRSFSMALSAAATASFRAKNIDRRINTD